MNRRWLRLNFKFVKIRAQKLMNASDFKLKILPLSGKLNRFASRLLNNGEDARDVVQDVFLKLWQIRDQLEAVENPEAFAMRMTRNKCLDKIRASRLVPIDEETDRRLKNQAVDVHSQVEWSETAARVHELIGQLPEQQQTVMFLRDIKHYEYEEIAQVTEMNANTIRVNLSRARKKVRDELLKTWNYENERSKNIAATLL